MKSNISRRPPPQRRRTNGGDDRLSNLPDEILCHILSFLPTKNAVATSILSSRYLSLWSCIPVLDFHDQPHLHSPQKFVEFVDQVLAGNKSSSIDTFKLSFENCTDLEPISSVNRWIEAVIKRRVVKMELSVFANHVDTGLPLKLLPCESLQVLKVGGDNGAVIPVSANSFPNLRVLSVCLSDPDNKVTKNLFTRLPKLEELTVEACYGKGDECFGEFWFKFVAPDLKKLHFVLRVMDDSPYYDLDFKIVIDAPRLEYLCVEDDYYGDYWVKNKLLATEVKVHVGEKCELLCFGHTYASADRAFQLLSRVATAKSLSLSYETMRALMFAHRDNALPTLHFLTKLEVFVMDHRGWHLLSYLLECAPNLRCLVVINKGNSEERDLNQGFYWGKDGDSYLQGDFRWSIGTSPAFLLLRKNKNEIRRLEKKEELNKVDEFRVQCKMLTFAVSRCG
ncbi:hypothetical protein RJ639_031745 [Escallonia herrerae]|uniref:F-box domain-containing protein n=1 Tax=Escallonia herrerae TaxID=1293975 RepID=A0AA88X3N4_9ASTE|nr:hypothetical protein RJ639_031745 [Escallonia herrerae]